MTDAAFDGVLFDECVDRQLAVPAFARHAPITFSRDVAPGAADPQVLALARDRRLILVTEDAGFGRLVFQMRLAPPVGIIVIALDPMPRADRAPYLVRRAPEVLARAAGALVTVGPRSVRARDLLLARP